MNPAILQLLEISTVCVAAPWFILRSVKYTGRSATMVLGDLLAMTMVAGFIICSVIGTF